MLLPLMLTGALAQAAEPDRIHGLRLGLCGGISTECLLVSAKVDQDRSGKISIEEFKKAFQVGPLIPLSDDACLSAPFTPPYPE